MTKKLTHLNEEGKARMVDVSGKETTLRTAVARGKIRVSPEVIEAINDNSLKKGDTLAVARVAGIMATKRTSDLIPLCHNINLTNAEIDFRIDGEGGAIIATCTISCEGKTGVEMEALTGVGIALLTIYDMCKAIDKTMVIEGIHLVEKTGGKSGDHYFKQPFK